MPDPENRNDSDTADRPTRLQRAARRGCAGLAYAVVLVPLVVAIVFFSTIPRGWEQFGNLVTDILWWRGADTEIVVFNVSDHDVRSFVIHFADEQIRYNGLLQARREADAKQNISHYKKMFFRDIKPLRFLIEIIYTEANTGVTRSGAFIADRWPREDCRFVIVLKPDGPQFGECSRPERGDFRFS